MDRKFIVELIALLFTFLFVYAGVAKLLDVEKFRMQIGQSPILTEMAWFAAWFIPCTEIVISIFLVIRRFQLVGLFAAFGLMVMFTAYIISILQFSEHIPCACGRILQNLGWTGHLIFNVASILLAITGIVFHTRDQNKNEDQLLTNNV